MTASVAPVAALLLGAGVGLGILLVLAGIRGAAILPGFDSGGSGGVPASNGDGDGAIGAAVGNPAARAKVGVGDSKASRRWIIAAAVAFVLWMITGWPALGLMIGAGVGVAPRLFGGRAERKAWIAKTQAIAAWSEMLRDTMAAADGVEEAIAATVPIAPPAIRREVAMLDARRRSEQPLPDALAAFGEEVDHPSCDLVVASLSAAAQGEGSDFVAVLTRLADMTRDEVRMRLRVEAGRAKLHMSGVMILAVIGVSLLIMVLMAGDYFSPYASATGQVILLVVGGLIAGALVLMNRMSRIRMPDRFSPRRRGNEWAAGAGGMSA